MGCGASTSTVTGAYVVTPSPDLVRSLQAIRGVEQRVALMRRSLASANSTYDNMAEAWNLVMDAVATAQPRPPGEAPPAEAPPGEAPPGKSTAPPRTPHMECTEARALLSEGLTEVQQALLGRRHRLSPEVLRLHGKERALTRAAQELARQAHCAEPSRALAEPAALDGSRTAE
ncbi:MAG: hypothetical protein JRI68_16125 [Deltaproteobacteria bacterium]|nr:hypothetical protein [Deltaproteobacteria bacterium]